MGRSKERNHSCSRKNSREEESGPEFVQSLEDSAGSRHEGASPVQEARNEWRRKIREARSKSWQELCESVGSGRGKLNWAAWRRTLPTDISPTSNITNEHGDLPNNNKEALNNLASLSDETKLSDTKEEKEVKHDAREGCAAHDEQDEQEDVKVQPYVFKWEEVLEVLQRTNTRKAMGPDQISPHLIKHGCLVLAPILAKLFTFSWRHGVLPQDWTSANIHPIYKGKGKSKDNASSFRPISLTSVVVKTMEKLVVKRLWSRIAKSQLMSLHQSGFRHKRSTLEQIHILLSSIQSAVRRTTTHITAAFLDITAAFDRCWREGILAKAYRMGIKGMALRWIKAYLSNRRFRTMSLNEFSEWFTTHSGVP